MYYKNIFKAAEMKNNNVCLLRFWLWTVLDGLWPAAADPGFEILMHQLISSLCIMYIYGHNVIYGLCTETISLNCRQVVGRRGDGVLLQQTTDEHETVHMFSKVQNNMHY